MVNETPSNTAASEIVYRSPHISFGFWGEGFARDC